jgi:DNA-binding MarR family transcriptional regulator
MVGYNKEIRESLDSLSFHLKPLEDSLDSMTIKTKPDVLLDLVRERKRTVKELCNILEVDQRIVSSWIDALESKKILKTEASLFGDSFIKLNGFKE